MEVKFLCVGDMHLGRLPARLPDSLAGSRLDPHELGPAAAWSRTVEYACREGVHVVVLAGDVVESDNARFEAFGPLQSGVEKLLAAGIDVCAVAGNHDTDTLPRLAALMDGFHLLGEGGRWSDHVVRREGQELARLVGWSFPGREVTANPLTTGLPPSGLSCPSFGVLHCDLYDTGSRYAPVRRQELADTGLDGWFLGHIHKPTLTPEGPPLGYLGSLVGLDPTETGRHGPWLVRVDAQGTLRLEQLLLAPLRWEETEAAVDCLEETAADLQSLLIASLKENQGRLAAELDETVVVGCRVRLTGRTPLHRELTRLLAEMNARQDIVEVSSERITFFVEKIIDRSAPAYDLAELSAGHDPPALLASDLLALQSGDDRAVELIATARAELIRAADHSNFAVLEPDELDDDRVRQFLLRAGSHALDELLAQQEGDW